MVSETPVTQPMPYDDFLNRIIDDGQTEVRERFKDPEQKLRLDGCIDGFEACRGKSMPEITEMLTQARRDKQGAYQRQDPRYWYYLERAGQIEFTLATLSAADGLRGQPVTTVVNLSHLRKAMSILAPEALAAADAYAGLA